jgi:hypothetical protein
MTTRLLRLRLLLPTALVLCAALLRADPYPSPPALPPDDLATLVVSAAPERETYLLGETVRVFYSVTNRGPAPITIRRDNSTAYWRPESLRVAATDLATGEPVPLSPAGFDIFNYRYGRRHTLAPGETWTHAFFPLRHVELPGPGRYRFRLRHTLGWPDADLAPAAPEFDLVFTEPSPEQAAALIATLPPLGQETDDTPLPVDTYGFHFPIYTPHLLARIAAGEPALLDSLDRLPTPEATAALIKLSTNSHVPVALAARRKLITRLPAQEGVTTYSSDVWAMIHDTRKDAAWTPAEFASARALARALLAEDLPPRNASGHVNTWDSPAFIAAALLARLGEASDLSHLAGGLQKAAYARPLDATAYRNRTWQLLDDETAALRSAYAGLRSRGIRAFPTATRLGEAILAFDEARLAAESAQVPLFSADFRTFDSLDGFARTAGPRSSDWLDQLYLLANLRPWPPAPSAGERPGHLGDPATGRPPHPVLLIAALESIPAPLPPECVPFINFALESDVPHVVHAACAVAVETRSPVFIPALLRVLATETDPRLRATVTRALAGLDDRLAAIRALADDLAVTPEPGELLRQLGQSLFPKAQPANQYSRVPLSRSARLALRDAWLTFIADHADRFRNAEPFVVGDPQIPPALFSNHITWRRPDESLWPAVAD